MSSRPYPFSRYPNSPQYEEDKCPAWGMQRRINDQNNPFFSENLGQPIALVRLQPDETLMGHFKIKCYLGNGSFGSVYLAEDMIRSTEVALKVAEVGPCNENIASLRLQREMNTHSTILDHKHVIRVHDLHSVPWGGIELLILSMEYADGGTFRDWLSEHSEDLEARRTIGLEYFKQACHGVGAIHDAGAIHLDLKPENLLFIGEVLKVSDLGSSRYAQILNQSSASYWNTSSVEEGTPIYKSPEHFVAPHPDDLDFRADIYSLGIILFELLHPKCRPPFGGSNERLREFHLHVPAPQLPEAGEGLAGIVTQCLQKDPDDRYQAVWELLEDLEEGRCSAKGVALSEDLNNDGATSKTGEIWEKASLWFSSGDFNEATRLTEEVLCMDPNHAQALQLREELRSRFDQADRFYHEIERNLDEGPLSHLVRLLQEAVNIYPDHPSGCLVQVKLHSRMEQFRKTWERISDCFSQSDLHGATRLLQEVLRIQPKDAKARQLMEELKESFTQAGHFYQTIDNNLEGGDLTEFIGLLKEACSIFPNHPAGRLVQTRLWSRTRQFKEAMEKGVEALKQGAWELALEWFRQARKIHPGSVELGHVIDRLSQIKDTREKIDEALLQKRFNEAHHFAGLVDLQVQNLEKILPILRN